jgi:hypothetical protein
MNSLLLFLIVSLNIHIAHSSYDTSSIWSITYSLRNPTSSLYLAELVRLPITLPTLTNDLCVRNPSEAVIYQVDLLSGELWVYIDNLSPGSYMNFSITSPQGVDCNPTPLINNASITTDNVTSTMLMSNGLLDILLPFSSSNLNKTLPPPPFLGFATSHGGVQIGSSIFNLTNKLQEEWDGIFSVSITSTGPLFAEVGLLYTFSQSGIASWRVRLAVGQLGAQVTEEYNNLDIESGIELQLSKGNWNPSEAVSNGWAYCDPNDPTNPDGMNATTAQQRYPLGPLNRLPNGSLGNIVARWSQSCDAKFFWGVDDGSSILGVLGVRGGDWKWPQYRSFTYDTMRTHLMGPWSSASGEGNVHLPLYGRRVWYLLGGDTDSVSSQIWSFAQKYAMIELDRLTNLYDLSWPESNEPLNSTYNASGYHFYSPDTDPTHTVRARGVSLLKSLTNKSTAPLPGISSSAAANTYCDPDWWGSYTGFSSPENPNFFTDWSKLCLGWSLALVVNNHPRSNSYCALARGIWELDLYHSIALPSGAGQESPGYTAHALASWLAEAPLLDQICPNVTNPARSHPRLIAAVYFLIRTSQPWAYHFIGGAAINNSDALNGRFVLPLGDTHPTSTNFSQLVNLLLPVPVPLEPVEQWSSIELPGFGALLQNRAGSPEETFFALKASPNRGHNHGDQLSFHYAAYGARIVIDVMAGYLPRPPQEFWHNRLCFGNQTNIDGTERLLGFVGNIQTEIDHPTNVSFASIAVGQVSNDRLQTMPARPPPNFLQVFPTISLSAPIQYRRTALLLPSPFSESTIARDCIVILDAHNASIVDVPAYSSLLFFQQFGMVATPLSSIPNKGVGIDMGNATVVTFATNLEGLPLDLNVSLDRWDWSSEGNENATRLRVGPSLTDDSDYTSLLVTILYPQGSLTQQYSTSTLSPLPIFNYSSNSLSIQWPLGTVDIISFSGALVNASLPVGNDDSILATLTRGSGTSLTLLRNSDLSETRNQGDIGLNILDAGYTFGEIPEQVIEERGGFLSPPSYPFPIPH